MKKVDGFTLSWDLMMAFTGVLMSIMSAPELISLLNKTTKRGALDVICIVVIVALIVVSIVGAVQAGVLSAYNTIVCANEEEKKVD